MTPRCPSRSPLGIDPVRCELAEAHTGRHASGLLVWYDPPRLFVGGLDPDVGRDTEHWRGGEVRLSGDGAA